MQLRSKNQGSVILSSTKAEWIALSEADEDILSLKHLYKSMGTHITSPITVRFDNMGAEFMYNNVTTLSRTRHVDIQSKLEREFVGGNVCLNRGQ